VPTTQAPPRTQTIAPDPLEALHGVFGFAAFRALQRPAIEAALDGRDALVVMPTGAGKSLCYQLPAAITPGVTLVVSPLVALMRDQVEALRERTTFRELGCAYLNSLQSAAEQNEVLDRLRAGELKLVYIAPERFRSGAFVGALKQEQIARFVVDEAHCISEWGHDFRPDYLSLSNAVEMLGRPPLMAVTATATLRVQQSIIEKLGMRAPETIVGGFDRPNLHFSVHRCKSEAERENKLARALPKLATRGSSGLIYVATRKQCEAVAALAARVLQPLGLHAAAYHAGLSPDARNAAQSAWLAGEVHTIVATNAFGMGIDKPNVRFVVHYCIPDSLESYYQEAGRAGRDGRKSRCVILYQYADRRLREFFINNEEMSVEAVQRAHFELAARARGENIEGGEPFSVPKNWWMQALGWSEMKTRLVLSRLEICGLVQRLGETADATVLRHVQQQCPPQAMKRLRQDFEREQAERYVRLNEMIAYCKTPGCRRSTLIGYFGDDSDVSNRDFCCDNCQHPPSAQAAPAVAAAPATRVDAPDLTQGQSIHTVLQGIDALRPQVGKSRLSLLLRGSNAQSVQNFKTQKCPLFGAFQGAPVKEVDAFLETLIEMGLLHQGDEDEYFVVSLTPDGRAAWQNQTPLQVTLPGAPFRPARAHRNGAPLSGSTPGGSTPPAENAEELFETLRSWRRARAIEENVPPYLIFSDRTLQEIANRQPENDDDLLNISGVGEAKLGKYGAAVLEVLRAESTPAAAIPAPSAPAPSTPAPSTPVAATARLAQVIAALPDTVADTYVAVQEGLDIEQIAAQRGLKDSTIWGHIAQIIEAGHLDEASFQRMIPPALEERVAAALAQKPADAGLKTVFEALDGEMDYGLIRCVEAWRKTFAASAS
jgi:ATP-dependent DNA helicase RecQ